MSQLDLNMQTKQLSRLLLCLALALALTLISGHRAAAQSQSQHGPRGRIRIADMLPIPHSDNINLPPGFGPQAPRPGPALLFPPLPVVSSTVHTHIPLLREQSSVPVPAPAPASSPAASPSEGRLQDTVVYGNWKPEHPLKPDEDEAQPRERVYGRLEAMLMGVPATAIDSQSSSSEYEEQYRNPQARRDSFERGPAQHGRRRIAMSTVSPGQAVAIRLNSSDPLLQDMAQQINESIETTTAMRPRTTADSWMPIPYPPHSYGTTQTAPAPVPVPAQVATSTETSSSTSTSSTYLPSTQTPIYAPESTSVSLNWPTDFLDNSEPTERIDRNDVNVLEEAEDYKYYEDSLNSAQMHSDLSIAETLLPLVPQLPLNITKVGVPYEEQNASEEPTICVPLTVTETSLATENAAPVAVEVERVYCFPLPKLEAKTVGSSRQPTELSSSTHSTHSLEALPTEQPEQSAAGGSARSFVAGSLLAAAIWSCAWTHL